MGSNNVGYDGTHGGYRYGVRNADGSRILECTDGINLVMCNTLFMKQESKLVTYKAGPAKSTVDYIIVQKGEKSKVAMSRSFEMKSVRQSILFVMDMRFDITKRKHNKFEPIIHVWKLKEEQTCEEYKIMV